MVAWGETWGQERLHKLAACLHSRPALCLNVPPTPTTTHLVLRAVPVPNYPPPKDWDGWPLYITPLVEMPELTEHMRGGVIAMPCANCLAWGMGAACAYACATTNK